MDRDRRISLTVGLFALVSLSLLAVAILSLSERRGIWRPRYQLVGYYADVSGLVPGAAVWLAGKRVGIVERVGFGERPDTGEPALKVVLQIDRDVQERIRTTSQARIATVGLLGDQIVAISMGSAEGTVLRNGEEIPTLSPYDINQLVSRGASALEGVDALARNLNKAVVGFGDEMGGRRLADALIGLAQIVEEVRDGDGLLHSLIYDQYEGEGIASIESSLALMENILREIDQGEGVLHSLIYDPAGEQDLVLQFLEAGARMNSILAKIDAGEGTLGLLLNDPTLYEEVKLLVGGANRSTMVRGLITLIKPEER
jgi:phospholipid/cholesterol/gamma-HCH transport system substrate-binding protein